MITYRNIEENENKITHFKIINYIRLVIWLIRWYDKRSGCENKRWVVRLSSGKNQWPIRMHKAYAQMRYRTKHKILHWVLLSCLTIKIISAVSSRGGNVLLNRFLNNRRKKRTKIDRYETLEKLPRISIILHSFKNYSFCYFLRQIRSLFWYNKKYNL